MTRPGRARASRVAIPLLAAVVAAKAGCGGSPNDDFARAKSGALRTPSEVLQEARAKSGEGQPKEAPKAETTPPAEATKDAPQMIGTAYRDLRR